MPVFNVRLLRAILVIATLAVWLAGANHCRLEQLPGMEFLACSPADAAPGDACESTSDCGGHEDSGCADDTCADDTCLLVEGALYQSGVLRVKADAPTMIASDATAVPSIRLDSRPPSAAPGIFLRPSGPPSGLLRLWQFAQRAAAPPRAPSFPA